MQCCLCKHKLIQEKACYGYGQGMIPVALCTPQIHKVRRQYEQSDATASISTESD